MYLKRLELHGFKSFASPTPFEFAAGVTCVVGPNGAGKTNVAEAIRWVLGEHASRVIRARKTEDVIFSGSSNRSPMGMAEVRLTLDNSDGWLPLDFEEVVVSRRAFRSGENEYYINQSRVRLKDVTELFLKAQIGQNSYAFMGQGLVEEVLTLRPEERRGLIEEAADVRLHRTRLDEARHRLGATRENPHGGPAHNPWNVERVTGGSSGGSGASVASGQCMGALGSDTGGSVRIPAGACGIVGLKPTFGVVSRYGVYPLSYSLDTVGPMTRTVRDNALVMNVIAGHDPRDPSSVQRDDEDYTRYLGEDLEGVRIGIPQDYFYDAIDKEVVDAVYAAAEVLRGLGAVIAEISLPVLQHSIAISGTILLTEAAEIHMESLKARPDDFDPDVRARLETGALTPAIDYIKAQRARTAFNLEVGETMKEFDALLAPTLPVGSPKISEPMVHVAGKEIHKLALMPSLTRPFNITGQPTISVPCGFTSDGMSIGMQLAGRNFEDAFVLKVAHAYEQATEWHTRRPPI